MTYQGHHSDGSGVQKHSCGDIYPYVIFAQGADVIQYGLIAPGQGFGPIIGTFIEAHDEARRKLGLPLAD